MPIGIVGAMPEEVDAIVHALDDRALSIHSGQRHFHPGHLAGVPVVVALSRIGKVAAAATITEMILSRKVSAILFTGVAGALDPKLRLGDVVVASRLAQHDLDASPLFPAMEVPMLGKTWFDADSALARALESAARQPELGARVFTGDMVSGDQFIASHDLRHSIMARVPTALCVDMESAAAAQVCHEYGVPLGVVRIISDTADDSAPVVFARFIATVAGKLSLGIIRGAALALRTGR